MNFIPVNDPSVPAAVMVAILDFLLKGLVLGMLGTALALACRKASASVRHLVWGLTLAGLLLLPACGWLLPRWQLAVLSSPPRAPALTASPRPIPLPMLAGRAPSNPTGTIPTAPPARAVPPPNFTTPGEPGPPAPPPARPNSGSRFPVSAGLLELWGVGAMIVLFRPALGLLALRRLRRNTIQADESALAGPLATLARELGLRRLPTLRLAAEGSMPLTWGWLRPVILLPRDAAQWPVSRLRLVLRHELAHVKRRDWLTQTLAVLAVALHWPNPLAWLAARRLRVEQERACDDLVLAAGARASDYAEELLQMATTRRATTWAPAIAMARRGTVERRLLAVLDAARSRCALRGRWWVWGGAVIAGIAASLAAVKLTEKPTELPPAYEQAKAADGSHQVTVGPNPVRLRALTRENPMQGSLGIDRSFFEHFVKQENSMLFGLDTPELAVIEVIEARLFDHATHELLGVDRRDAAEDRPERRLEILVDGRLIVWQPGTNDQPSSVDLWIRGHSHAAGNDLYRLTADPGASVELPSAGITVREIQPGLRAHAKTHSPEQLAEITWGDLLLGSEERETTVVFDQTGVWNLGQYQVAAVDREGRKWFPSTPHFIDFAVRGRTQIIRFPVVADQISHFEWRPFGGRHRFYFADVKLPDVAVAPIPPATAATGSAGPLCSWGPIQERVISFDSRDLDSCLDLDTGEFVDVTAGRPYEAAETAVLFEVGEGTDIAASGVESDTRARMGVSLATVPADGDAWSASPDEVLQVLLGQPSLSHVRLAPGDETGTWFFRTDEGNVGVLDLTAEAEAPDRVHVRWKLVRGPAPSPEGRFQIRAVSDDPRQPAEILPGPYGRALRVLKRVLLDESAVARSHIELDPVDGRRLIRATLTPWGAAQYAGITGQLLGKQLALVFEGRVLYAPMVRFRIATGDVGMSGHFTNREAQEITAALNRGKPPVTGKTVGQEPIVLEVAQDGSADYRTIQAAIDAAPLGAVIHIRAGHYAEHLEITEQVSLVGNDWRLVTIRPREVSALTPDELQKQLAARLRLATSDAERREIEARMKEELGRPVLTIRDASGVGLRGIKFTAIAPEGQSLAPEIIAIRRSGVHMMECAVLGGPREGIRVVDGSEFGLSDSLVAAVWGTGVQLGERDLPPVSAGVWYSDVRNCHYAGIRVGGGAHDVRVNDCRISGAAWHGIRYDDTNPRISRNYIFGNARSGIYASGQTEARIEGNIFHRNEMGGMSCWFNNHDLITGNTFVGNLREGLSVLGSSQPSIIGNVFANEEVGIAQGIIGDKSPSATNLVTLRLDRNLFWNNATNLVAGVPGEPELKPAPTPLPEDSHSVFADPRFVHADGGNFSLAPDSPVRPGERWEPSRVNFVSPFPLQPEELAIIPDTDTRDSRAWKKP